MTEKKKVGRPFTGRAKKTHAVRLSDEQYEKANRIGVGNVSSGIRKAIDMYHPPKWMDE